jgi:hypothetical protein
MDKNQQLISKLQGLLSWKKSKKYYADKLNVSESVVDELMKDIREQEIAKEVAETAAYIGDLEEAIIAYKENFENNTGEIVLKSKDEIKSLEELIEKCKIDTDKWEISKYVQNYWGNSKNPHWQVKAWLNRKKEEDLFQNEFIDFLKEYTPHANKPVVDKKNITNPFGCLIINKQDAHYNKLDIGGDNDIHSRMGNVLDKIEVIVNQAILSNNVDVIYYVVGSDEFNSEFTGTTTKGTPQQNIHSYHDAFQRICDHEVSIIELLLSTGAAVHILYVPGNHDEYVGWHLVKWLEVYFKETNIVFETSPSYRKYISFGNSALMFNHGDVVKPSKLASLFPIEFKDEWSYHDHFYIFTGDKHHELSQDFNGIKFYQIPAFSSAKSSWDDKNGHVGSKPEVTAFLIDVSNGMTNIFKQYL